jgi:hypothetical protein
MGCVGLLVTVAPAASADGADGAKVVTRARFLNAVAGAPTSVLEIHGHPPIIAAAYGKPSRYRACHPGPAKLVLKRKGSDKPSATLSVDVGRGRYTIIAVPDGQKTALRVYKDGAARSGKARLRTIHAAPELGRADLRVDGRLVGEAGPGAATQYASLPPGRHDLSVTRPGGAGGALVDKPGVPLVAGTAQTAILVGSRGMPTDVLLVSDQTAGPATAPATGFIGEDSDAGAWLAILCAALLAGTLGGTSYLMLVRRARPAPEVPRWVHFTPAPPRPSAPPAPPAPPRAPAAPPPAPEEPADGRAWAVGLGAVLTAGAVLLRAGRRRGS